MPEPRTICELLARLWADQNNQIIRSISIEQVVQESKAESEEA